MRIRHTSDDHTVTDFYEIYRKVDPPGGSEALIASGSYTGLAPKAKGQYFEDVVTPQFEARRANGEVFMNPCRNIVSERNGEPVSDAIVRHTYVYDGTTLTSTTTDRATVTYAPCNWLGDTPLLSDLSSVALAAELSQYDYVSVSTVESGLLAQCLSKASTGPGTLALVTIAELPKTLDLLAAATKSMSRLMTLLKEYQKEEDVFRAFTRLSFKEIKILAKSTWTKGVGVKGFKNLRLTPLGMRRLVGLCGLWLGYRYGIMATYYDIMSWSRDLKSGKYRLRYVSSTGSSYANGNTSVSTSPHVTTTTSVARQRTTQSSAGCLVSPEFEGLSDSHGAGRIISTAWELMPLSFVLDWLYDVSTRIAAFETSFLCSVKGTWIVHRSDLVYTATLDQTGRQSSINSTVFVGSGSNHVSNVVATKFMERKANPAVSYLPSLRVNLNWKRLADGIALTVVLRSTLKNLLVRL